MNIGEHIHHLRKENDLSQDDFAGLFSVSRQTVSNWENGKSYPDLEMIIKISEHFQVSVDELLKGDNAVVQKIDLEKKKKNTLFILMIALIVIAGTVIIGMYLKFQANTAVNFSMEKHETYSGDEVSQPKINIGNGYFTLPKSGKLNINTEAETDDGKLHIVITDEDNKIYYQLDGQTINDVQSLYFKSGSYIIQITADDYTQDVVSLKYNIKINN